MQQQHAERVYFFDAYRTIIVLSVLALHAAMSYMAYVPGWWYVINPEKSLFFLFWVLIVNTGDMPAIFFLAGYFAPRSLEKRGRMLFLKEKALHIGIPWIVGVLAFAPLFAMATWRSLNLPLPETYMEFVRTIWLGPGYQQSHFWFLGVLMVFLIVFAAVGSPRAASGRSPLFWLAGWWGLSSAAFFLSSLYLHPDLWIRISHIYFQPARIVSYALAFYLGARAWRDGWFDGSRPGFGAIALSGLATVAGSWSVIFLAMNFPVKETLALKALHGMSHSFASLSIAVFFLFLCRALFDRPSPVWRTLSEASYGIYWLHQMILMPAVYLLIPWNLPIGIKFILALGGTYILCAFLTIHGLKKLPVLRRLF